MSSTSTTNREAARLAWAEIRATAKAQAADTGHCSWCKMPRPGANSSSICPSCTANQLEVAAVEVARKARMAANYSDFEDYLQSEGRPNPYSGIDEWSEAV